MYDVVFMTPNMQGTIKGEVIGTLQIATILKEKGMSCRLIPFCEIGDLNFFEAFLDRAVALVEEARPKILSFYTRSDIYHISLRTAERVKEKWPEIYVVMGGPQSDITAKESLERLPYIDFVCCGEGEATAYPLFASLLRGSPDYSVEGLVYRKDGKVMVNPRPALIENLDSIPFIDYSLLPEDAVKAAPEEVFSVDVGRGCPFGCTFCSTNSFWGRKFRLKSPERICEEIRKAHDLFGYTRFNLSHDMFTFRRKIVYETCKLFREMEFPVRWGCSARLDCIDRELIDEMAASGMEGIYIGIETGSPRMQKLINKNLKLEDAVEKVAYLKSKGIKTTASFIYGFPEETEEDVSQTLSLIAKLLKLRSVRIQTHLCAFFAGTELLERYAGDMTPVERYSDQTGELAIQECRDLIEKHPALFPQLREYRTEMRTKLRYFEVFVAMWSALQPVYQYISEKYPEDNLIQMYYDFVQANQEILDRLEDTHGNVPPQLVRQDQFPHRFSEDEHYDLVADYCRMVAVQYSQEVLSGGTVTELYCFAPSSRKKYETLQEYPRCTAMVHIKREQISEMILPM